MFMPNAHSVTHACMCKQQIMSMIIINTHTRTYNRFTALL